MIFNSLEFVLFFVVFFVLYWLTAKKLKIQNLLLLIASYVFYAYWDWRFLFLIVVSSFINYALGIYIGNTQDERKKNMGIWIGVVYGILSLGYFKYTHFFIDSLVDLLACFHIQIQIHTLNIILPLGISFYTFRTLSYILDVDKGKIKPVTDWVVFFAYVAFFPSLISGPIDRARTLVPQLEKVRVFDFHYAVDGLKQILWGAFKKIVIADNCAEISQTVFDNYGHLPADTLLLGALFYTIQLYADFSGYSDMAIGTARLLGFTSAKNFNYPFFSQNIAQYWRNWHISLTSWLTEYVFTPLSIKFRDWDKRGLILAIVVNFIVVGIWHGANWTFVLFGLLHGCYFIPLIVRGKMNKTKKLSSKGLPTFKEFVNILTTFILVMFTNILFRSESISQAFYYIKRIFTQPALSGLDSFHFWKLLFDPKEICVVALIVFFFVMEWMGKESDCPIKKLGQDWKMPVRWLFYYTILFIVFFFAGNKQEFIYFQF